MIQDAKICGVVLAGGQARRFGMDKRLVRLAGHRLIDLVVQKLRPQVDDLVLSCNDVIPGLENLRHLVDQHATQGPLIGIAEGLAFAADEGFDWLVTVPVDSPFLPDDLVQRLITHVTCAPIRFAGSDGRRHPIFGVWPSCLVRDLWALIIAGERKIDRAAEKLGGFTTLDWFPDPVWGDVFFNINTRADLQTAQRLYRDSKVSI